MQLVAYVIISKVVNLIQECLHLDSEGRINDRRRRTHTYSMPGYIYYIQYHSHKVTYAMIEWGMNTGVDTRTSTINPNSLAH